MKGEDGLDRVVREGLTEYQEVEFKLAFGRWVGFQ